jgi:hypothetical protein
MTFLRVVLRHITFLRVVLRSLREVILFLLRPPTVTAGLFTFFCPNIPSQNVGLAGAAGAATTGDAFLTFVEFI